jgi:hypothetical protein
VLVEEKFKKEIVGINKAWEVKLLEYQKEIKELKKTIEEKDSLIKKYGEVIDLNV